MRQNIEIRCIPQVYTINGSLVLLHVHVVSLQILRLNNSRSLTCSFKLQTISVIRYLVMEKKKQNRTGHGCTDGYRSVDRRRKLAVKHNVFFPLIYVYAHVFIFHLFLSLSLFLSLKLRKN